MGRAMILPDITDEDLDRLKIALAEISRYKAGQFHETKHAQCVIKLVRPAERELCVESGLWWEIEFLPSGRTTRLPQNLIGRQLSEMEVLARMAE